MASLVATLLQRVGTELLSRPYSPDDETIVHEDLPEPMLEVGWGAGAGAAAGAGAGAHHVIQPRVQTLRGAVMLSHVAS